MLLEILEISLKHLIDRLSDASMIFPISLIAYEKMRKKFMWKKDMVLFYCVIISLRTNIHNDSCKV